MGGNRDQHYLNIYIVKSIDGGTVLGYGWQPHLATSYDGIVMDYKAFGDNSNGAGYDLYPDYAQGKILIHELGHYLALDHPFLGGCPNAGENCSQQGDRCCDTPPLSEPNFGCPSGVLACDGSAALVNNFMDYTDDVCEDSFTNDQVSIASATMRTLRSGLCSIENLELTGACPPTDLYARITIINPGPCVGEKVFYGAAISPAATGYSWTFPGGNPSSSTDITVEVTYNSPGQYDAILSVSDGTQTISTVKQTAVDVTNCAPLKSTKGNWYFGDHAGVTFANGKAESVEKAGGNPMYTIEACAAISDQNGKLLFYTNGRAVYDTDHNLISDQLEGSPNTPLAASAAKGVIIVPNPGNSDQYYIFYTGDIGLIDIQIKYTLIDMSLAGGKGGILAGTLNTLLPGNHLFNEGITAIPHCDGIKYWLIAKPIGASMHNKVLAYLIDQNGVQTNPVESNAMSTLSSTAFHIKVAGNGNFVCFSGTGADPKGQLYDFNRQTGQFLYITNLATTIWGQSFSPNSAFLYGNSNVTADAYKLFQYDLRKVTLATSTIPYSSIAARALTNDFQLGPDGKIYGIELGNSKMNVITRPNQLLVQSDPAAIGFQADGVVLDQFATVDLPNLIDAEPGIPDPDFNHNVQNCLNASFYNTACGTQFEWDFGDGSPKSFDENPTHSYSSAGTYHVTFKLTNGKGQNSITKDVVIENAPIVQIAGPTSFCKNDQRFSYSIGGILPSDLSYSWAVSGGVFSQAIPNSNTIDGEWNSFGPNKVSVTVTNSVGCTSSAELTALYTPLTTTATANPPEVAAGSTSTLSTSLQGTAVWSDGATLYTGNPFITPTLSATKSYTVTVTDTRGCSASSSVQVSVLPFTMILKVKAPSTCINDGVLFVETVPTGIGWTGIYDYKWSVNPGLNHYELPDLYQGTYSVTVTHNSGFTRSASIVLPLTPVLRPMTLTSKVAPALCDNYANGAIEVTPGVGTAPFSYSWSTSATGSSIENLASPGQYTVSVTDALGCYSTAVTYTFASKSDCFGNCPRPYTLVYGNPNTTLTYTPATPGGTFTLSGNVYIAGSVVFKDATVLITPNTKIYVAEPAVLPFGGPNSNADFPGNYPTIKLENATWDMKDGALLTAACSTMWGGLIAGKNAKVYIQGTPGNMCELSHSMRGAFGGREVNIHHTRFLNNYKQSIYVGTEDANASTGVFASGLIQNNTIDCNITTVKYPMKGNSVHPQSYYSWGGIQFGYFNTQQVDVSNNTVSNMLFGVAPFFENSSFTLHDNTFNQIKVCGVYCYDCNSTVLRKNDIYLDAQPLSNGQTSMSGVGIPFTQQMLGIFSRAVNSTIAENSIYGLQPASSSWAQHGYVSAYSKNVTLEHNTIEKCRYGMDMQNASATVANDIIRENIFNGNQYGVYVAKDMQSNNLQISCNNFDKLSAPSPARGINVTNNGVLPTQGVPASAGNPPIPAANKYTGLGNFPDLAINNLGQGFLYYCTNAEYLATMPGVGKQPTGRTAAGVCGSGYGNIVKTLPTTLAEVLLAIQLLKNNLLMTTQQQTEMITKIARYYKDQLCGSEFQKVLDQLAGNVFAFTQLSWLKVDCQIENKQIQQALATIQQLRVKNFVNVDIQRRADFYEVDLRLRGLSTFPTYIATEADISTLKQIAASNTSFSVVACYTLLGINPALSDCFAAAYPLPKQGREALEGKVGLEISLDAIPNPFNGVTTLRYKLGETYTQAVLKVYTLDGKILQSVSIQDSQGEHLFEGTSLPAGIYLCHIEIDGQKSVIKKLVLIK